MCRVPWMTAGASGVASAMASQMALKCACSGADMMPALYRSCAARSTASGAARTHAEDRGGLRARRDRAARALRHGDDLLDEFLVAWLAPASMVLEPDADVPAARDRQLGERRRDVAAEDAD